MYKCVPHVCLVSKEPEEGVGSPATNCKQFSWLLFIVCVRMCVGYVYRCSCMWRTEVWCQVFLLLLNQSSPYTVDRQGFSLDPELLSLIWPVSVRDHPASTSQCWDGLSTPSHLAFYLSASFPNLGPHAYVASPQIRSQLFNKLIYT